MPLPLRVLITAHYVEPHGNLPAWGCRWETYRIGLSPPQYQPSAWLWRHPGDPHGRWQPTWQAAHKNGNAAVKKYNLYDGVSHLAYVLYQPDSGYRQGFWTSLSVCKGAALMPSDTPNYVVLDYYSQELGIDLCGHGVIA